MYWLLPCLQKPTELASYQQDLCTELKFTNSAEFPIQDDPSQVPLRKPPGASRLLAVVDGKLILVTGNLKLRGIPITSPFIRFSMLVSSGLVREALQLTHLLHKDLFEQAARIMSELGHTKSALELPYLPDALKFELALKHHLEVPMNPQLFADSNSIRRLALANKQNKPFLESFYTILTQHNRHIEALEVATIANHPRQMLKSLSNVNCGRAAILAKRLKDKALEKRMLEAVAKQIETEDIDLSLD